jgi:hypothetical protein
MTMGLKLINNDKKIRQSSNPVLLMLIPKESLSVVDYSMSKLYALLHRQQVDNTEAHPVMSKNVPGY